MTSPLSHPGGARAHATTSQSSRNTLQLRLHYIAAIWAPGAQGACRLRLELDGAGSPFVLTSINALARVNSTNPPLRSDSKFYDSIVRAWTGSLYATAASLASCPAPGDRAGWLVA